jgi:hypothetical protein
MSFCGIVPTRKFGKVKNFRKHFIFTDHQNCVKSLKTFAFAAHFRFKRKLTLLIGILKVIESWKVELGTNQFPHRIVPFGCCKFQPLHHTKMKLQSNLLFFFKAIRKPR